MIRKYVVKLTEGQLLVLQAALHSYEMHTTSTPTSRQRLAELRVALAEAKMLEE